MLNIAIDGPAGAGKSTVAKAIAARLGITYLDTGAMYRAVALYALDNSISPEDEKSVVAVLDKIRIEIKYSEGTQVVYLNGEDVSLRIRENRMSKAASDISKIPAVRLKLVEMQRAIAAGTDVVMDGRDIGSYVLPDANYKFFLTASPAVRAKRRFDELTAKGEKVNYDDILGDIEKRDRNDSTRAFAPLRKTDDAEEIDSSALSAEEVVGLILEKIDV